MKVTKLKAKEDGQTIDLCVDVAQSAVNDGGGRNIQTTYAEKSALTDGSVTKVGISDVGSATAPIHLVGGVPTVCTGVLDTSSTPQTKSGGLTVGKLDVSSASPTIGLGSTTNGHAIVSYTRADGQTSEMRFTASGIRIPTASGSSSLEAVNKALMSATDGTSNNLVHRIGAETIAGTKTFTSVPIISRGGQSYWIIQLKNTGFDVTEGVFRPGNRIAWTDKNDVELGSILISLNANGSATLTARVRNADGTLKTTNLLKGD